MYLFAGGYRTADNRFLVIRSGRQATVWERVNEDRINQEGSYPWFPENPDTLVDIWDGGFYVNMWDSVNIGDAKFEVETFIRKFDTENQEDK